MGPINSPTSGPPCLLFLRKSLIGLEVEVCGETGRAWYADGALRSLCPELALHGLTCTGAHEEDLSAPFVASVSGIMVPVHKEGRGRRSPDAGSEP